MKDFIILISILYLKTYASLLAWKLFTKVMVVKKNSFIKTKIESNSQIISLSNINLLFKKN
jgi:hypothetical protein